MQETIPVVGNFLQFKKFVNNKVEEFKNTKTKFDVLPTALITPTTRYVLVNTIYKVRGLDFKRHIYLYGAYKLDEVDEILEHIKRVKARHNTYKQ